MNLFSDRPPRGIPISKETVDNFHGSVLRRCPSALEQARIVENRHTTGYYKTAPVVPIALHGSLSMVSVDQEQVNRIVSRAGRVLAEFFYPHHFSAPMAPDGAPRHPLHEIQRGIAAEMKWIDQVECPVLSHCFAKRQRRNPFGHADFHQNPAPEPSARKPRVQPQCAVQAPDAVPTMRIRVAQTGTRLIP